MANNVYTAPKLLYMMLLGVVACNTSDPEFNASTIPERVNFSAPRQYPEGITYSPTLDQFLVSSITQGKIGLVDQNGRYTDFITKDEALIGSIGMKVRNNLLYVCNGDQGVSDQSKPQTALKTAGLFIYDLRTRQNVARIDLASKSSLPNANHFANDIAFDADGKIYVTDSFSPIIYKIVADGSSVSIITSPLFEGAQGINLNGIVYHPDKYLLVVKSNEGKLFKVSLEDTNVITEVTGVNLPGGDGMVLYNNDLYVVNGRTKVSQIRSSDGWKTASLVKTDEGNYNQATTNVLVNDKIFTLNARIDEVSAAAAAKNPGQLQASTYSIQQFK